MQMVNIFNELIIPIYYFSKKNFILKDIKKKLYFYLDDNLDKENYQTFCWDLSIALTTNANEEYI
jgi:hypothetical protein